ncbi:MAG TPA: tetratricopeptide repeat protein [Candidatus Acidoferrum sp.]
MLAAVLLLFAAWTIARNAVWKDDSALFTRTLETSPSAPFAQDMVAAVQPNNATGQSSAESHYLTAISLAERATPPDRLELAIAGEGLASIYAARGEYDRALRALAQVRLADPKDPQVDGEERLILAQAGRWTEAEAALRRAVVISPNDANVLNALGLIAWRHDGHLDEAASIFPMRSDFIRRPTISTLRCTAISARSTASKVASPMPAQNSRLLYGSHPVTPNSSPILPPPSKRLAATTMPGRRSGPLLLPHRIINPPVTLSNS